MNMIEEWLNILLRFSHVIAGITWIGTSFYFNWFDLSVRPDESRPDQDGVRGTLTEVHGGSFYYHEHIWPSSAIPRLLNHSGPAQLTLLSGILLLSLVYWMGAQIYLVDAQVRILSIGQAVAISAGSLVAGWLAYHSTCKLVKNDRVLFALFCLALFAISWMYFHLFSARAAVVHIGALIGCIMSLNVIFVIVPCHIGMRDSLESGKPIDRRLGSRAKRRSQHNNYLTLPVLFCMLGIHFSAGFGHAFAWLILPTAMLGAFMLRLYRNQQHRQEPHLIPQIAAALLFLIAIALSATEQSSDISTDVKLVSDAEAMLIVSTRCTTCHSTQPTDDLFTAPPLGFTLDNRAQVTNKSAVIYQRAILDRSMPPGNLSGMTEDERSQLGIWLLERKSE